MIRPPEESRDTKGRKPGEPPRPPFLVMLAIALRNTAAALMTKLKNACQIKIASKTATLEERMSNARNSVLTPKETERLLKDPSPLVRVELVFNDTISGETLERLKRDPDFTVATVARRKSMGLPLEV